ncbi:MAG: YdhR family protein [Paludibaculum sp.]
MILQINFTLHAPAEEYQTLVDSVAPAFRDIPGLVWKIWLLNPSAQEAGGLYLFDSQASLDAYRNGPLMAQLRALPFLHSLSMKQFEIMPGATIWTRGPLK